jgi:ribosome-binding protein aMBF1 (putative translation factor)
MSNNTEQTTRDAVKILHRLYYEGRPDRVASLEAERLKVEIGQRIYDLRTDARLTQNQLAEKVGTNKEVIDTLEATDYEDHELGDAVLMIQRIAKALGKRVEFQVAPDSKIA